MEKNQNMQRGSLMHITMRIQQSSRRDLDLSSVHFPHYNTTNTVTVIFPGLSWNEIFLEFYHFNFIYFVPQLAKVIGIIYNRE